MKIREILYNLNQSEIFKLVFNGKAVGLRVKSFNVETEKFDYYDFDVENIKNQGLMNFIKSIKNMNVIELRRTGNGLLMSDDEIQNGVVIQEFENETVAMRVLHPFIRIYKLKN